MKDKLIATITLGFIFSLFFYYKVANSNNENLVSSVNNVDLVEEFVQEVIQKENNMLDLNAPVSDSINTEVIKDDDCNLDSNQTDELEFAAAFKYYRNCNGIDSSFYWNSKAYSTVLKSEIENNVLLTVDEEVKEDYDSAADKKHLQLQNQLIGDNLK